MQWLKVETTQTMGAFGSVPVGHHPEAQASADRYLSVPVAMVEMQKFECTDTQV